MSGAAVTKWKAAIEALQQLVDAAGPKSRDAAAAAFFSALPKEGLDLVRLRHTTWMKLLQDVQVIRKLVELCTRAQQQHAPIHTQSLVAFVLFTWLNSAQNMASSGSRTLVIQVVQQQLREAGLLQHLTAILAGAADELIAVGNTADGVHGSSGSGSDTAKAEQERADNALMFADVLLDVFIKTCSLLSPAGGSFSLDVALPAAPAAVRLALTIVRACHRLPQKQQHVQQSGIGSASHALYVSHRVIMGVGQPLLLDGVTATVQRLPGVRELLLSPDFTPCLAITAIVAALGLDPATPLQPVARSSRGSKAAADISSKAGSSTADRGGVQHNTQDDTRCPDQQPDCSATRNNSNSSSTPSSAHELPGCSHNNISVSLASVTPLAAGWFELLGVDKQTLVTAAGQFKSNGIPCMECFTYMLDAYSDVLAYQVDHVKGGVLSQHLLLQLEADLLLTLLVEQLTAGSHLSYTMNRTLHLAPLLSIQCVQGLHSVPLAAPYTGPQLALQVHPTPAGARVQRQEQQQQPQLHVVPVQTTSTYVLAPTAALLGELLPMLTKSCLTGLEALWEYTQQQQKPAVACEKSSREHGSGRPGKGKPWGRRPDTESSSSAPPPQPEDDTCERSIGYAGDVRMAVQFRVNYLAALLFSSVVPQHTGGTATEVAGTVPTPAAQARAKLVEVLAALFDGAATGKATAAPHVPAAACKDPASAVRGVPHTAASGSCVLHAQDAIMPHAVDIMRVLEGSLRDAAAGGAESAGFLTDTAHWVFQLCMHEDGMESALVMLARAAGPGSREQRQLYNLLCSLLKASPAVRSQVQTQLWDSAAFAASALLAGDVGVKQGQQQQQRAAKASDTSPGGAVAMLPSVFILGRCCLKSAGQFEGDNPTVAQPAGSAEAPQQPPLSLLQQRQALGCLELSLAPVHSWLQAGSTSQQLAAAGYAPQRLLQQLEQLMEPGQVLNRSCYIQRRTDKAALSRIVRELRSLGGALCSFAVPFVCNNPACCNMSGLSERRLVTGPSCKCGGCRVARFCSHACLKAHWKQHKRVCGALAIAAANGKA